MLQRIMMAQTNLQKFITKSIIGLIVSFATFGFFICVLSLIIIRVDTPQYILIPITTGILTFASFIDSFLLAKIFKENGLLIGLLTGFVFVVILLVCAFSMQTFSFSSLFFTKFFAIMLAGALGGLLGVII